MWTTRTPSTSEYSPGALGWGWSPLRDSRLIPMEKLEVTGALQPLDSFHGYLVPILVTQDLLLLQSSLGVMVSVPSLPCRSKLTNEDFRKLLMTPRAAPTSAPPSKSRHHE